MGVQVVDPFYKQNLSEWIYDEHKLITYQFLSINLKVHVNLAKQMLYEFYNEQKKHKNIHALYYISGLKSIETKDHDEKEQLAYAGLLCKEEQLNELKKGFSYISSVHIYGLEESEETSEDKLCKAIKDTCFADRDDENENSITKYGPFKPIEPKTKADVPELPPVSSAPPPPLHVVKHEKKLPEISSNNGKVSSIFGSKPLPSQKSQGTLDFSKAKKTEKKPEIKVEETKPLTKPDVKRNHGSQLNGKKKRVEKEVEKARKRIRVISSSSESEKNHSEDSDDDVQKHKKRKHFIVPDSSDDDDTKEIDDEEPLPAAKKPTLFPTAPKTTSTYQNGVGAEKRRKKMKTIIKEYEDEEGYRVTKKEVVMVSDSDSESEHKEIQTSKEKEPKKPEIKVIPENKKIVLTSPPSATKQPIKKPSKNSSSIIQKQKQTNIMSFFKKQPV